MISRGTFSRQQRLQGSWECLYHEWTRKERSPFGGFALDEFEMFQVKMGLSVSVTGPMHTFALRQSASIVQVAMKAE